jgi:hypothetical protein
LSKVNKKERDIMETYTNPLTNHEVEVDNGYCWGCFFFGALWYVYKGVWRWAVISFVVVMATWGVAWLFFPFFANGHYKSDLLMRGYKPKEVETLPEIQEETKIQEPETSNEPEAALSEPNELSFMTKVNLILAILAMIIIAPLLARFAL